MAPQPRPQTSSQLPSISTAPSRHPRTPSFTDSVTTNESDDTILQPYSVMFSALCMFDFTSTEARILSFRKNEILDIITCNNAGWWAAMRKGESILGWVPQAFVNPLSQKMAERLREIREELRVAELERVEEYHSGQDAASLVFVSPSPIPESKDLANLPSSTGSAQPYHDHSRQRLDIHKGQNIVDSPQSHRSSPTPHRPLGRSVSALVNPRSSLPQPKADDSRMRSGSLPIASTRRQPVIIDDVTLPQISTLIRSTNSNQIDNVAASGRTQPIRKQIQDDKRQKKFTEKPFITEGGVVGFENISNAVHKQIQRDKLRQRRIDGGPVINIGSEDTPWYLRFQYTDQLDIDDKGNVRSGSLLSLVEMLTTDSGTSDPTEIAQLETFTNVFLMTFRTFTTADCLFDMLVERFHLKPEKPLTGSEYLTWKVNICDPMQYLVLEAFSTWLEDHRLIEEEPHIVQRLKAFLILIVFPPHNTTANTIIQKIDCLASTNLIRVTSSLTPKKARKVKINKLDLLRLDPKIIAEQLTVYEFGLYVKITPQQCLTYSKTQTGNHVAKLRDFCSTHDKLGAWVNMSILNSDATGRRALTIDLWIKVAERCHILNNISSMSAIITALSSTVITALRLTWAHTSRKPILDGLLQFNDPTRGFAGYRNLLQQVEGPCVPFITMFLTEMAHVQDQFSETGGQIYFYPRARWYEIITAMLKFQSRPYNIAVDESIASLIEGNLREGSCSDPSWFWKRSQEVQKSEVTHADIRKGLEAAGF